MAGLVYHLVDKESTFDQNKCDCSVLETENNRFRAK